MTIAVPHDSLRPTHLSSADTWRVRYLVLLGLIVACADLCEQIATAALAGIPFDVPWGNRLFCLGSSAGPFFAFAAMSMIAVRRFNVSLWWLTLCATAYALLTVFGLLVEYGMSREAVDAAARGSRYMNCAGSPRFYLLILSQPVTFIVLSSYGMLIAVELTIRRLMNRRVSVPEEC